jgi:hypothetical protein
MGVKAAGLLAKACLMLCHDCCTFRMVRFCRLNGERGSSAGGHWMAQASLLLWLVIEALAGFLLYSTVCGRSKAIFAA